MDRTELRGLIREGRIYFRGEEEPEEGGFLESGADHNAEFVPDYDILVRPGSTEEVARLVEFARKNRVALVPSGGRTGLTGGAAACNGEIVVSLARMNRILGFDRHIPALHVEAGVITAEVQRAARERGLYFPLEMASSGSSTIGGNIATNAGGIHVIRYGSMRNWTLGVTAVTGCGEILHCDRPVLKNNSGFDLKELLIGSEGLLAIITEARIRLTAFPGETGLVLCALEDVAGSIELLARCRESGLDLLAFEYFDRRSLRAVHERLGISPPFSAEHECYTLFEYILPSGSGTSDPPPVLPDLLEKGVVIDALFPASSTDRRNLWRVRESISEALAREPAVHKCDISVPIEHLAEFLTDMAALLAQAGSGYELAVFGHLGDGNIHLNILKPGSLEKEAFYERCRELDDRIYGRLADFRGAVSGEHGIGMLKPDYLGITRSQEEIELMRAIKRLFDPDGILNPGKVLSGGS